MRLLCMAWIALCCSASEDDVVPSVGMDAEGCQIDAGLMDLQTRHSVACQDHLCEGETVIDIGCYVRVFPLGVPLCSI